MTICRVAEETKKQSEEMQSKTSPNQVDQLRHRKDKLRNRGKQDNQRRRDNQRKICRYCGSQYDIGRCPAYGKLCKKCGKRNHFAKVCLSSQVNEMNARDSSQSNKESIKGVDNLFIGTVNSEEKSTNHSLTQEEKTRHKVEMCWKQNNLNTWTVSIDTSGLLVECKIDTGAQANVIPQSLFKRLPKQHKLHQKKEKLFVYDATEIPTAGKCILRLKPKGKIDYPIQLFVFPIKSSPILGLATSEGLNLIKPVMQIKQTSDITQHYAQVFRDTGCLSGEYRKVPYLLKDKLKAEPERMERNEIIDKID